MHAEVQRMTGVTDSSGRPRICAVIVSFNIGEAIHPCFNSIRDQVDHVVIVDNGSDELTRRELSNIRSSGSVTLILNERNEGIARAFNQAIAVARGKDFRWMLTLDHDSEATPGMVDKLVKAYAALEKEGIQNLAVVGANPFDTNAHFFITRCPPMGIGDVPIEEGEVISSGSLIEFRVLDAIGPFNEDLFAHYVDIDFCIRLAQRGFRVFLCPDAVLLHREGTKESMRFLWRQVFYDRYSRQARYYLTRNTLYLIKKYHPLNSDITRWILRRLVMEHIKIILFDHDRLSLLLFSCRGFVDGLAGRIGPAGFSISAVHRSR